MPFISEELYQRLPRDGGIPSICIAPYPVVETCPWKSDEIEREVEYIQKVAKLIRSARSDYNLPNKTKTEIFIVCSDNNVLALLRKFGDDLSITAFCQPIDFDAEPPSGCAILTVTGECEVHLLLKGLIEVDKELQKLEKKKIQLENTILKLNHAVNAQDYITKVPADIQQANTEKLKISEGEITRIIAAMAVLKTM